MRVGMVYRSKPQRQRPIAQISTGLSRLVESSGASVQVVTDPINPASLAVKLSRKLTRGSIKHAIGGAIALGFWSEPRGTYDLDINLFLVGSESDAGISILENAGVTFSNTDPRKSAIERGDARGYYGDMPVDLFFNSIPVHDTASERIVFVELSGERIPILSAEDLVVFKLLFDRAKDRVDIERLVDMKSDLDVGYINSCLEQTVGSKDHRVDWWNEILGKSH